MISELEQYLADNYGHCTEKKCDCLEHNWKGISCLYWVPLRVKDYEELRNYMKKQYERNKNEPPP